MDDAKSKIGNLIGKFEHEKNSGNISEYYQSESNDFLW